MEVIMNIRLSKKIFNSVYYPMLFNYENRWEGYFGGAGSGKSQRLLEKKEES